MTKNKTSTANGFPKEKHGVAEHSLRTYGALAVSLFCALSLSAQDKTPGQIEAPASPEMFSIRLIDTMVPHDTVIKVDRNGKVLKTKRTWIGEPNILTVPIQTGKLLSAGSSSYYAGSQTQVYSPSQACLNVWWCHILAGDPSATTQAIYSPVSVFVIQGPDYTYAARDDDSDVSKWIINAPVRYAIDGNDLYMFYEKAWPRKLTIYQKMLNATLPAAQPKPQDETPKDQQRNPSH